MVIKLSKDKKAIFRDLTRSITVGNVFFFILILMFSIYVGSLILSQIFKTTVIKIGVPFKFLLVIMGLTIAFYVAVRRQGDFDKSSIFALLIIFLGITALFYYGPKILPEVFSNSILMQSTLASGDSPFTTLYNVSSTLHNNLQSFITTIN